MAKRCEISQFQGYRSSSQNGEKKPCNALKLEPGKTTRTVLAKKTLIPVVLSSVEMIIRML
jgi:hypothetical protein